jgi:hypothetical protein
MTHHKYDPMATINLKPADLTHLGTGTLSSPYIFKPQPIQLTQKQLYIQRLVAELIVSGSSAKEATEKAMESADMIFKV